MSNDSFVIVGGGLAGATAAAQLREHGFDGDIHLFASEAHNPYERPPLSKGYMNGNDGRDSVFVQPSTWYSENNVVLSTAHPVTSIEDHAVVVESGRSVSFDRLLIATGASARELQIPGSDAEGIQYLRTVDDSEALHEQLSRGGRNVVVVGAGWIGLELAAAARAFDNSVTVVAPQSVPLAKAIGDELGTMFREVHEAHGVTFMLETDVLSFEKNGAAVSAVVTSAGTIPADVVIVGIGAIPNSSLAEAAGIEVDNGILVNEHLMTSKKDVFAAGDVANAFHPVLGQRMRNEHWATAIASGTVAARSMLGDTAAVLDDIPYFFTDQYDLGMEYSGYGPLTENARIVFRGDRAAREFIAFWVADNKVVAGMNVNVWDVNEDVQKLIRSARPVSDSRLADSAIPLSEV